MKCVELLEEAKELIGGERAAQHGPKRENHQNIADAWNAHLRQILLRPLTPLDVTLMMVLLKVARTKCGIHNWDDYRDMAGYAAISGELADEDLG